MAEHPNRDKQQANRPKQRGALVTKAVGYALYGDGQGDLVHQERAMRGWCLRYGFDYACFYVDDAAKVATIGRPGLSSAVGVAVETGGVVVTYSRGCYGDSRVSGAPLFAVCD